MEIERIDLYSHFGFPKPDHAKACLTCYRMETSHEISAGRKRPAMLVLPGGAYRFTSAREAEPVALRLSAAGFAAFVLNYSCAPCAFPVALREAAMAMRFIRENAAHYEVDPHMVAAMGFSAGGHLCGTLGTMYDCPEVADIGPASLLRPDALGLCYPVTVSGGKTHEESFLNISGGDEALRDRLSLDRLARPDMPPVFLWHTRDDQAVPCYGSIRLAAALEEAGVPFAMHIYRQGSHGLSNADETVYAVHRVPETSWDIPGWLNALIRFLGEIGFRITDQ